MDRLHSIVHKWKTDFDYKTFFSAGLSLSATVFFALYNGFLGVQHQSLWNGSICADYLMLSLIRAVVIFTQDHMHRKPSGHDGRLTRTTFHLTSVALIAINLTLVLPISLMVKLEKPVNMGLIPVIGFATYTCYRITRSCINFIRSRRSTNVLTRELRSIGLMDALLAIITMQNALVSIKDTTAEGRMLALTAISSAFLFIGIITISVRNYLTGRRLLKGDAADS